MICWPCRDGYHIGCVDLRRLDAAILGDIPGMRPGSSQWCDCQHQEPDQ